LAVVVPTAVFVAVAVAGEVVLSAAAAALVFFVAAADAAHLAVYVAEYGLRVVDDPWAKAETWASAETWGPA
jgi:hypothetical protein